MHSLEEILISASFKWEECSPSPFWTVHAWLTCIFHSHGNSGGEESCYCLRNPLMLKILACHCERGCLQLSLSSMAAGSTMMGSEAASGKAGCWDASWEWGPLFSKKYSIASSQWQGEGDRASGEPLTGFICWFKCAWGKLLGRASTPYLLF